MVYSAQKTNLGQKFFIVTTIALPWWIIGDYSVHFVDQLSCENFLREFFCGHYRPERDAILPSLSVFRAALVVGNCLIAWLVYQRRPMTAALGSLVVLGFFIIFYAEYSLLAGDAMCAANSFAGSCGPSSLFLELFLETYDKVFLALFPFQFLWIIGIALHDKLNKTRLR